MARRSAQRISGSPPARSCRRRSARQTEPWEDKVTVAAVRRHACSPSSGTAGCTTTRRPWTASGRTAHIAMYAGLTSLGGLDRRRVRQAPAARPKAQHQHGSGAVRLRARARRAAAGRARRARRLRVARRPTASRTRSTRRSARRTRCSSSPAVCWARSRSPRTWHRPGRAVGLKQLWPRDPLGHLGAGDGRVHVHEPAAVVLDDDRQPGLPGQPAAVQRRVRAGLGRRGQARRGPRRRRDQLQRRRVPVLPVREHALDRRDADLDRRRSSPRCSTSAGAGCCRSAR